MSDEECWDGCSISTLHSVAQRRTLMTFGQESEGSESEFGDTEPKSIPCREISCKGS